MMPPRPDPIVQPLTLPNGAVLRNRVCKAATAEGLATLAQDPSASAIALYRRWGGSGVGVMISGNAHVDRRYVERSTSMVLDAESDLSAFAALANAGQAGGASFWLQLNHAGQQCPGMCTAEPVGPSANAAPFRGTRYAASRALTIGEIEAVVSAFARSAALARQAGFAGVQIHAAHGYLLSSFLSPIENRRVDRYGGSAANRARLLMRVIDAVRNAVGRNYTIALKLNATDFVRGGFDPDAALDLIRRCDASSVDCIEISGGTYRKLYLASEYPGLDLARYWAGAPAMFGAFAKRLPRNRRVRVLLTGGITTRRAMTEILTDGDADLIGMARPFCIDPHLYRKLAAGDVDLSLPHIRLGRGPLGPRSWFKGIRRLNALAVQSWYSEQLPRLAAGEAPDFTMGGFRALQALTQRDRTLAALRKGSRR